MATAVCSPSSALVEVPYAIEKVYDVATGQPRLAQTVWQPQMTAQRNAPPRPTTKTKLGPAQAQAEEASLVQKRN